MKAAAPQVRANVLDRLIGWADPERGARRLAARGVMTALAGNVGGAARAAGSQRDRMAGWLVKRLSRWEEGRERDTVTDRAEDLVANDGLAASAILALCLNVVGAGLRPQSWPDAARLGLTEDETEAFAESAETAWELWARHAGLAGESFYDLQYQGMHSFFAMGELTQLPLMLRRPFTPFGLCLQTIHPSRLRTPADLTGDASIRDGVELGELGEPVAYWVADPPADYPLTALSSAHFRRFPRFVAHRRGFFHAFHLRRPEQVRGDSVLGAGMVAFRHLADFFDYELIRVITQSSLPMFIETEDPLAAWMRLGRDLSGAPAGLDSDGQRYQEIPPGTIGYGRPGEKPHLLDPKNPGPEFDAFAKRFARIVSASTGQPYEAVMRDFSESNYSNTRAALLEAWKLYKLYHAVYVRQHGQLVWEHVLEEAYLLGMLAMPKRAPGFYEARDAWCAASWNPPARGYVDPVKEKTAYVLGLDHNLETLSGVAAEQGADYRDILRQRARERRLEERLGLTPTGDGRQASAALAASEAAERADERREREEEQ